MLWLYTINKNNRISLCKYVTKIKCTQKKFTIYLKEALSNKKKQPAYVFL